nr:hypothetical protein [uncultured Rhodopila sp.]
MVLAGTFTGIDPASRRSLSDWLAAAVSDAERGIGRIDSVSDLSRRPWRVSDARTIIGVFEKGKESASWLIVGHQALWTLVRCQDGFVSESCSTLREVLTQIDEALRG